MKKRIIAGLFSVSMVLSFTGCGDISSFPLSDVPGEFTSRFEAGEFSVLSDDADKTGEETYKELSEILKSTAFDVSYDNTSGCFCEYAKIFSKNQNDEKLRSYQTFMTRVKGVFEKADECVTNILQPDNENHLKWKKSPNSMFSDYGNIKNYTGTENGLPGSFSDSDCPMSMWVNRIENEYSSDSVFFYMSDLNEQNGVLSEQAKKLKNLLENDQNSSKDLMILDFKLKYSGDISVPSDVIQGIIGEHLVTKNFDNVDRVYYIVGYGERDVLRPVYERIGEELSDAGIATDIFSYRDCIFRADVAQVKTSDGTDIDNSFTAANPVDIIVNGTQTVRELIQPKSEQAKPAQEEKDDGKLADIEVGSTVGVSDTFVSDNIKICTNKRAYFTTDLSDDCVVFTNVSPKLSGNSGGAETVFTLSDSRYRFDRDGAWVKFERAAGKDTLDVNGENEAPQKIEFTNGDSFSSNGVTVNFTEDAVTLKIDDCLRSESGNVPAVMMYIPVELVYTSSWFNEVDMKIPQEVFSMIENCSSSQFGTEEELYTRTYAFDKFMDNLIDYSKYRQTVGVGEKAVKEKQETGSSEDSYEASVLKAVFVADIMK